MKYIVLSAAFAALVAAPAVAVEPNTAMGAYVRESVQPFTISPEIIDAVNAQNSRTADLSEAEIIDLDDAWRAEVGSASTPMIDSVLKTSASDLLREHVSASGGLITELFVMDQHGLNVASSGVTSDYWQGDEAKFQETHGAGTEELHVSEVEFDESAQTYQGQVSYILTDPATGAPIGAVTVGLSAEAFF